MPAWNGKTIALDIGGVCISLHNDKCLRAFGLDPSTVPPAQFFESCALLSKGLIDEKAWLDNLSSLFEGRLSHESLRSAWNAMLGPSQPGMKEAVEKIISLGYRFVYLSDTSTIHMTHFFRTNDFCHLISGGVFSYDVGALKPESPMYEEFERRYGKPCYYADDLPHNVEAGLKRGWRSFRFTSPEAFLADFLGDLP